LVQKNNRRSVLTNHYVCIAIPGYAWSSESELFLGNLCNVSLCQLTNNVMALNALHYQVLSV